MIRKLLPIVLALIGLGAGIGAGMALRPPPDEPAPSTENADGPAPTPEETDVGEADNPAEDKPSLSPEGAPLFDYVKLNNQFVVPVVQGGKVSALVVMSLSLEVPVGRSQQVFALEPKLRDAFLQVLFDHANSGGFAADFTETKSMVVLRDALRETAVKILGAMVTDVLITDLIRQNV